MNQDCRRRRCVEKLMLSVTSIGSSAASGLVVAAAAVAEGQLIELVVPSFPVLLSLEVLEILFVVEPFVLHQIQWEKIGGERRKVSNNDVSRPSGCQPCSK